MDWQELNAGEAFALTMLTVIAFSFGTVLTLLAVMLRSGRRRDREVERLIEEVSREECHRPDSARRAPAASREAWERDPDWWQSG